MFEKLMLKLGYVKVKAKKKPGRKPGPNAGVRKPRTVKKAKEQMPVNPTTTPYPLPWPTDNISGGGAVGGLNENAGGNGAAPWAR